MLLGVFFLYQFTIYFLLQARFLFGGDSAEFATIAETWSIAHPPGYPLYSLILNVLRVILFNLPRYYIYNLPSILPSVLSAVVLYLIIKELHSNKLIAIFSSLCYCALFPVMLYSLVPEVFALNNLLITLAIYLSLKLLKSNDIKYFYSLGFVSGLAFAHHHTYLVYVFPLFFLLKKKLKKMPIINYLKSIFFFFLASLFYIYVFIAAFNNPPIDYEHPVDIQSFIRLISRASYGTFKTHAGAEVNIVSQLYNVLSSIIYILLDFKILGFLFILTGVIYIYKKKIYIKNFVFWHFLISAIFLFYLGFIQNTSFASAVFERFLTLIYIAFFIPFSYGIYVILNFLKKIFLRIDFIPKRTIIINIILSVFFFLYYFSVFFSSISVLSYVPQMNEFNNYANDILTSQYKKSLYFPTSDTSAFTIFYTHYVLKTKPSVIPLNLNLIQKSFYQKKIKKTYKEILFPSQDNFYVENFLKINSKKFKIYSDKPLPYGFWQYNGLVFSYSSKPISKTISNSYIINLNNLWRKYHIPRLSKKTTNILHLKSLADVYANQYAIYLSILYQEKKTNLLMYHAKRYIYYFKTINPEGYRYTMLSYVQKGKCKKAKPYFEKFLSLYDSNNINHYASLLNYISFCDTTNSKRKTFENKLKYLINFKKIKLN